VSGEGKQVIKIKPSLIPFTWNVGIEVLAYLFYGTLNTFAAPVFASGSNGSSLEMVFLA
jgi:hypothetical protein